LEPLTSFSPGDIVPISGQYWVVHLHHRRPHKCLLNKGARFPQCKTCLTRVMFEFASEHLFGVEDLYCDGDFAAKSHLVWSLGRGHN
jgi:hypothetical protein